MNLKENLTLLFEYKIWANQITFAALLTIDKTEIIKERKTNFKNIAHTLNHIYVIDNIFKSHLTEKKHNYKSRNTDSYPELNEIFKNQKSIDN